MVEGVCSVEGRALLQRVEVEDVLVLPFSVGLGSVLSSEWTCVVGGEGREMPTPRSLIEVGDMHTNAYASVKPCRKAMSEADP